MADSAGSIPPKSSEISKEYDILNKVKMRFIDSGKTAEHDGRKYKVLVGKFFNENGSEVLYSPEYNEQVQKVLRTMKFRGVKVVYEVGGPAFGISVHEPVQPMKQESFDKITEKLRTEIKGQTKLQYNNESKSWDLLVSIPSLNKKDLVVKSFKGLELRNLVSVNPDVEFPPGFDVTKAINDKWTAMNLDLGELTAAELQLQYDQKTDSFNISVLPPGDTAPKVLTSCKTEDLNKVV